MGIGVSFLRWVCCLDLDDDDDRLLAPRTDQVDHPVLNRYARLREPLSASPDSYTTATISTAREAPTFAPRPVVTTSAPSLPRSSACARTTRAGEPTHQRVGSATSATLLTPALSTQRLQQPQATIESRGQSSRTVEANHSSFNPVTSAAIRKQTNRALETPNQPLVSATSATLSTSVSSTQQPQRPQGTIGSRGPGPGPAPVRADPGAFEQNTATPATSTTRRLQAAVSGGSTSAAVGTVPVKREVTNDVSGADGIYDVHGLSEKARQKLQSPAAEIRKMQTLSRSPRQSNRSSVWGGEGRCSKTLERLAEKIGSGSPTAPIPVYEIPPYLKEMIRQDEVPDVLMENLSASNYSEKFACLLYAEDFYLEKWSKYLLKGVTLEIHKRSSDKIILKNGIEYHQKLKDCVAFEFDSIREKRPYISSRDFVFLQSLEPNCQRIQGRVVRVLKSTKVLAEFEDDFWSQHYPNKRYDVSFSFNRVCLKRAHHAVANALGPILFGFLFPENVHKATETTVVKFPYSRKLGLKQIDAVNRITNLKGFPPYLIAGLRCLKNYDCGLTEAGHTICEAILQIDKAHSNCRILICTPKNTTCDTLMIELSKGISESRQFRANAAFRDYEDVPDDILPSCQFNDDDQCFICPPLPELQAFKVVTSTYMSCFRLRRAGIKPGHFTHIFLIDACTVAEPEAVVPLANLASEDTAVVISGCPKSSLWHVRSDVARSWGLQTSYFSRLLDRDLYENSPSFICRF